MSNIDPLISGLKINPKSFNRDQLVAFVKESLLQISEINAFYKEYFENTDSSGAPSVFADIELKIEKIKEEYSNLYSSIEGGESVVIELSKKIEDIKKYHSELLSGEKSVQSDIKQAHKNIKTLYTYLFGDGLENLGIDSKLKEAIESIFESQKTILEFETRLHDEIKPSLDSVQKDIDTKRQEVDALLSNAVGSSLAHGYAESKYEYSKPAPKKYKESWTWFDIIHNTYALIFNLIWRHVGFLLSYFFFIAPLLGVSFIFINAQAVSLILKDIVFAGSSSNTLELIYVKTIISIPLVWVAWYAQKNISQRKRLFEEYNHKQRVVQMYLMFSTNKESYPLEATQELEEVLLAVIQRNPSEVFGRDETILDKFAEILRASKDVTEGAVKAVAKEVNDVIGNTSGVK